MNPNCFFYASMQNLPTSVDPKESMVNNLPSHGNRSLEQGRYAHPNHGRVENNSTSPWAGRCGI